MPSSRSTKEFHQFLVNAAEPNLAIDTVARMRAEDMAKELDRKLKSLVTDVCDECLGNGSLQFCGGETCPSCDGTGKPPKEVSVFKCIHCGTHSPDPSSSKPTWCTPGDRRLVHEFKLDTIYTKPVKEEA